MVKAITNANLTLSDIPPADADWQTISEFALTFDGYTAMGSFDACAEVANAHRHNTLTEIRACLFFEQRRWRHFGEDPSSEEMEYFQQLLSMAADKVRNRQLD